MAVQPGTSQGSGATVVFNRFRVIRRLGRGAIGAVYLAHDELLHRDVALKVLARPDAQTDEQTRRLNDYLNEARAIASVAHPHIVPIYDVLTDERRAIIAMEYLAGGDLAGHLRTHGALPATNAARLLAGPARGLAAAHQRGLIHRDIKPANLMLTADGLCKLVDFGAALEASSIDPAQPTRAIGTPYTIAPELLRGNPPTPACDIYSLGCTLWYVLVGCPPFDGENPKALYRHHLHSPVPPIPSQLAVPASLADLLVRMLAKDPDQRPASMSDVAQCLEQVAIPVAVARPVSTPDRRVSKAPSWAIPAIIVAGLLVVVVALTAVFTRPPRSAPASQAPPPAMAPVAAQAAPAPPAHTGHVWIRHGQVNPHSQPSGDRWNRIGGRILLTGPGAFLQTPWRYEQGDFELVTSFSAGDLHQSEAMVALGDNQVIFSNEAGNLMIRGELFGHPRGLTVGPSRVLIPDTSSVTLRIVRQGQAIDFFVNDQRVHASQVRRDQPGPIRWLPGDAVISIEHLEIRLPASP